MQNADNSYAARTRRLASTTLALFHRNNPTLKELGPNILDESTYLVRKTGDMHNIIQTPTSRIDEAGCSCEAAATCTTGPGSITNFVVGDYIFPVPPPYDSYTFAFLLSWDPVTNATSYEITAQDGVTIAVELINTTSAYIYTNYDSTPFTVTLTAINDCGSSSSEGTAAPCFLAGSLVTLADGTQKVIEDIAVGDLVLGAFGEVNEVLALHRPLLGSYYMIHINGDHYSSAHHPHVTADAKFVCAEPAVTDNETYGREHTVINAAGQEELRMLHGLKKGRVQKLALGNILKTVGGSRLVESLERADMPPETQLYNLVVGGSHTYHVDGYAVTGWPREDDFDYDTWKPLSAA